jgi:hypothetical protein
VISKLVIPTDRLVIPSNELVIRSNNFVIPTAGRNLLFAPYGTALPTRQYADVQRKVLAGKFM